jgi:predicted phage gp36 major capsid-like protein
MILCAGEQLMEETAAAPQRSEGADERMFQGRILTMLEGAALALLADYLQERDAATKAGVLKEVQSEAQRLETLRSELERSQYAFRKERRELRIGIKRADRRVQKASRIVRKYRSTLVDMREQINGILGSVEDVFSDTVTEELEAIVRRLLKSQTSKWRKRTDALSFSGKPRSGGFGMPTRPANAWQNASNVSMRGTPLGH